MAESGWHNPVYEALNRRLIAKGISAVLPGEWKLGEFPEVQHKNPKRGHLPYANIEPTAVRDQRWTNRTKYATVEFRFEVHAKTFAELDGTILPAVTAAMEHANIVIPGDDPDLRITMVRPGDIEYEKVEQIWTASMIFFVQANQPSASTVQ